MCTHFCCALNRELSKVECAFTALFVSSAHFSSVAARIMQRGGVDIEFVKLVLVCAAYFRALAVLEVM